MSVLHEKQSQEGGSVATAHGSRPPFCSLPAPQRYKFRRIRRNVGKKLYLYTVESKISKKMEATTARKPSRRRKKLTPEERKAINAAKPAGNKYVEAARRHQGEVWVKDPMLML